MAIVIIVLIKHERYSSIYAEPIESGLKIMTEFMQAVIYMPERGHAKSSNHHEQGLGEIRCDSPSVHDPLQDKW